MTKDEAEAILTLLEPQGRGVGSDSWRDDRDAQFGGRDSVAVNCRSLTAAHRVEPGMDVSE
jgi:hypothetical protein